MNSFPSGDLAVVVGATGGIGAAVARAIGCGGAFTQTIGLSRNSNPALGLQCEESIARCARYVAERGDARLIVVATGILHGDGLRPEKSWRQLDPVKMAETYAVNAIGPALLMKHFLPLLPRDGKAVFAALSARVGSIADNGRGGWYSYRASKAALNQLIHTASIELKRLKPQAICVALHPGTVLTSLSAPFGKSGLDVQLPDAAAERLLHVIDSLESDDSGSFLDHRGEQVPW